jgi:hypothetical protein
MPDSVLLSKSEPQEAILRVIVSSEVKRLLFTATRIWRVRHRFKFTTWVRTLEGTATVSVNRVDSTFIVAVVKVV